MFKPSTSSKLKYELMPNPNIIHKSRRYSLINNAPLLNIYPLERVSSSSSSILSSTQSYEKEFTNKLIESLFKANAKAKNKEVDLFCCINNFNKILSYDTTKDEVLFDLPKISKKLFTKGSKGNNVCFKSQEKLNFFCDNNTGDLNKSSNGLNKYCLKKMVGNDDKEKMDEINKIGYSKRHSVTFLPYSEISGMNKIDSLSSNEFLESLGETGFNEKFQSSFIDVNDKVKKK